MRELNFHLDLVPDEDRQKADVELRWMVQDARKSRRLGERFLFLVLIAAAAVGGVYWQRNHELLVYQCAAGVAALWLLVWLIAKIRHRRRFKSEWEMAVLKWHGARNKIKEAIRIGHPKEAMAHSREEAKARGTIMDLLRL